MERILRAAMFSLALTLVAPVFITSAPVLADPPRGLEKGQGKGCAADSGSHSGGSEGGGLSVEINIGDHDRVMIHQFYNDLYQSGRLSAGFSKKTQWLYAARASQEMGHRPTVAARRDFL